ncbi:MAG: hypothetical protein NC412_03905 [Roseburia sp.]|nr:hypothetical protein [Roseburia sp.]MCM1278208.1 hypothetical protein [Robinsoniella sp.]
MDNVKESREEIIEKFKPTIEYLARYIPWLEKQTGQTVAHSYKGEGEVKQSFSIPVYDGTLLSFINDVSKTNYMDNNYQYVYTKNHLRTFEDEWKAIDRVDIMHMEVLCGIMSRYVLGGMTKSIYWKNGVEYEIFLRILKKTREIVEFWDKPIVIDEENILEEVKQPVYKEVKEQPEAANPPVPQLEEDAEELSLEEIRRILEAD